jgi:hypothetical protein
MREGDEAPGLPGVTFLSFFSNTPYGSVPFGLNDRGDVAFSASLAGPGVDDANDVALFLARADGTIDLVRVGGTGCARRSAS